MKFAFKSLVAAAAFMAVGAASAANWTVGSGTGGLTFSKDALGALETSGSEIYTDSPIIPATLPNAGAANSAAFNAGTVALTFDTATIDGNKLTSLSASNSVVNISRTILSRGQVVGVKNVYLANFKVDLSSSTIFADVYSDNGGTSALISAGNRAIFTASIPGVVGGTGGIIVETGTDANGNLTGAASGSLNGELKFNVETANIVLVGLGLDPASSVGDLVRNANWGATTASGTFTAAVPEPSTYALLIAGLATAGAIARRRKAA